MNHWYPQLYDGTTPGRARPAARGRLPPDRGPRRPRDRLGAHPAGADARQAVLLLPRTRRDPRPVPRRARQWIEKYAGRFDAGWDAQREQTLARQKELGIVPADDRAGAMGDRACRTGTSSTTTRAPGGAPGSWRPTPASPSTPTPRSAGWSTRSTSWASSTTRCSSTCSGDNGASGEGGPDGTHPRAPGRPRLRRRHGRRWPHGSTHIGDPTTYPIYPVGWALAMNTPYQWTKQVASHYGGTRDGMIVHWPARHRRRAGEVRHQWHHVIDVLPTILDAVGLPHPTTVDGVDPAGDRGHQPALHLRRRRTPRSGGPRSTSRWSATAASTTRAGPRSPGTARRG